MKFIYYSVVALFIINVAAFAQTSENVITLDNAVNIALGKNLSVLQAQYSLETAKSMKEAAVGKFLPNLSVGASWTRSDYWQPATPTTQAESSNATSGQYINGSFQAIGSSSFTGATSWSAGLSASMTLLNNGLGNNYGVERANEGISTADYTLTRTQQGTVFQVNTLYLTVVRDYELLQVAQGNLKSSQKQLEQIQESEKVGSLALADVYRQQTTVEQNNFAVITANSNFEKAKLDVLNFLGVDPAKVYTFDFSGVPTDIDTTDFVSLNAMYRDSLALMNGAIEKRPDYLANVAAYNSADIGVTAADGGYLPSLTAQATYGFENSDISKITDDRNLQASLNLSIPIFNGFQTQTTIQQAEISRDNADQTVKSTKRQVVVDVRKALLDLQASEQEIISGQKGVVSSSLDAQTAHEKYNLGSNTLLDVLTAEANYTSALSNKVNGVNDFLLAKKELEYALGTIKN